MARVLYGNEVTELKGSIGGITFHKNTSGNIAKKKPTSKGRSTIKQFFTRSYFSAFRSKWSTLSSATQTLWNEYAALHTRFNYFNEEKALTGMNWYISVNVNSLIAGGSEVVTPPYYLVPIIPTAFTVEWSNWSLQVIWPETYMHTDDYLFIYATPPMRQASLKNRKDIRLIGIAVPGQDDSLNLTESYMTAFGLSQLPSSPDGSAKILVCIASVSDTSFITSAFMSAIANKTVTGMFDTGSGFDTFSTGCLVSQDTSIFYWGQFETYNGCLSNYLIKLRPDGSIDTSFNVGSNFSDFVLCLVENVDGTLYVGGSFANYGSTPVNRICKLDRSGNLITSFNTANAFNGDVNCILVQSTGKLLVGGSFNHYGSMAIGCVCRLNVDGSLDTSFYDTQGTYSYVKSFLQFSANKVLVTGLFTYYGAIECSNYIMIDNEGEPDSEFFPMPGANGLVNHACKFDTIRIMLAGSFSSVDNVASYRVIAMDVTGDHFISLNDPNGFNTGVFKVVAFGSSLFVCGEFSLYNNVTAHRIIKLDTSFDLDNSFDPVNDAADYISDMSFDENGNVYIAGNLFEIWGTNIGYLARLAPDGSLN